MSKTLGKEYIKAFIIGSSVCVTIFPLLSIAIVSSSNPDVKIGWPSLSLFFPIVFGLVNAIGLFFKAQRSMLGMLLLGAVLGLLLSSYGLFVLNYPEILYGLKGNKRYLALLGGPVFYGLVFLFPMFLLNKLFDIGIR